MKLQLPGEALLETGRWLIDRMFPDKQAQEKERLSMEAELRRFVDENERKWFELAQQSDKYQTDTNTVEAGSSDPFVSRWRPFIGWVCGAAFAYHFILQPLLAFSITNLGHTVVLPAFDIDALFTVLMGMLGLGGLRTFERIKGKA
jgi:hypothetical protein